jgi:peptidoglycan/xylan/chitin deacetylase (PgdA/CDA1 family)/2-polyprenyl-3-methyl-5-hydroxy-6-metoxy-1,4-benzoquinol methylase
MMVKMPDIFPLSWAHLAALGTAQATLILLPFGLRPAMAPLVLFILVCLLAPLMPRLGFFLPIISRGPRRPAVALTFDDGPDPEVTPRLLELLDRHQARATFFVTGVNAERHPQLVREILARGHTIGNHTYHHSPFVMLQGSRKLRREIVDAQRVLKGFGVTPRAFRPPVGVTNPHLWRILLEEGMFCVNFSCRALDFGNRRVDGLSARLLAQASPGDIILMHDVAPKGADADRILEEFETFLSGLRNKGLDILPLGQLLGKEIMETGAPCADQHLARRFYDGLAAGYDEEQFGSGVAVARRKELELFTARLPTLFASGDRVLDMGAGTGIFTLPIARRCREVVAVDISRKMLDVLERKAAEAALTNIRTQVVDLEKFEPEGTFSVVCAFASLEYISDLPALLKRLAPHVRAGGVIYLIVARRSWIRFFTRIGNAMRQGLWMKAYGRAEISEMLAAAGFQPEEVSAHLFKSWWSGGILLEVVGRRRDVTT